MTQASYYPEYLYGLRGYLSSLTRSHTIPSEPWLDGAFDRIDKALEHHDRLVSELERLTLALEHYKRDELEQVCVERARSLQAEIKRLTDALYLIAWSNPPIRETEGEWRHKAQASAREALDGKETK